MKYLVDQGYHLFMISLLLSSCMSICGIAVWKYKRRQWLKVFFINLGATSIAILYLVLCVYISMTNKALAISLFVIFIALLSWKCIWGCLRCHSLYKSRDTARRK